MHRLIVHSATYRQASRVTPALHQRDPYNRLFARGPRLRLSAEAIRDNALAMQRPTRPHLGGASVFPYQPDGVWFNPYSSDKWVTSTRGDQYRRGLYTFWRRTAPYAAFMAFDAPSREVSCERRPVHQHALAGPGDTQRSGLRAVRAAPARRLMTETTAADKEAARPMASACVWPRSPC